MYFRPRPCGRSASSCSATRWNRCASSIPTRNAPSVPVGRVVFPPLTEFSASLAGLSGNGADAHAGDAEREHSAAVETTSAARTLFDCATTRS